MKNTLLPVITLISLLFCVPSSQALTDYFRLTLRGDPATSIVIGWRQSGAGTNPKVYWGTTDGGIDPAAYPNNASPSRQTTAYGMNHCFVRLTNLTPDTKYYFIVHDSDSTPANLKRLWFQTAPNTHTPFTFIAGGDSRTFTTPRRQLNMIVAKLRPRFVAFGGDFVDGGDTNPVQWPIWLSDWQLTISPDGRMCPIVVTRGNHDESVLEQIFDTPSTSIYHAFTFGGSFLRLYTLNTEDPGIIDSQASWLASDLNKNPAVWKVAQYHKPMFPHTTAKEPNPEFYDAWAAIFHQHRVNLVIECDSHLVKRTWPLRPSTEAGSELGYIRDDSTGTVFIGEGCWGAPLRSANSNKPWTRASDSFNQFDWIHVYPDRMEVRTVGTANYNTMPSVSDSDPFTPPAGLQIWDAPNGAVATITREAVQRVTLRDGTNGYTGTRDTQIAATTPNTNSGTSTSMAMDGDPDLASLLKWDVSSIPAGKKVIHACLDLYAADGSIDQYQVYGLKRDWAETAATWNQYASGTTWQTAGANGANDRGTSILATMKAPAVGSVSIPLTLEGVALVQSWVDTPATNFGLAFMNNAVNDSIYLSTRNNSNASQRPGLTITYKKGTTVSFQDGVNGYTGTRDSKIRSDAVTTNYGTSTSLEMDGSPDYAALVKWDLSSIPSGKIVKSVQIHLYVGDTSWDVYELYALKRDWNETGVNWNQFSTGNNWQTAGASGANDRGTTVLGSLIASANPVVSTGEKVIFLNADGIAQVQAWVNSPSTNYGFILCDYAAATDGIDVVSSEGTPVSRRPKITIVYE